MEQELFQQADDMWQALLVETYGEQAGSMRYLVQGQGLDGSHLRAAYTTRYKALRAWHDSMGKDGL